MSDRKKYIGRTRLANSRENSNNRSGTRMDGTFGMSAQFHELVLF